MKENWIVKKFSDVFDLQMGKTPSRDNVEFWGNDYCWVAISDIKGKYISETKEYISNKAVVESKIKKVKAGTVVMSFKLTVGRTAIAKIDLYTNEAIMAFNLKPHYEVLPEYTYYYLKAYKWQGANKAVMGITLNKASISANYFVIPPLPEQTRIVEELDQLSNIIEKKRQQLSELDNLAQSIFYDMFGDPMTNEKGWEVKKLGDVYEINPSKKKTLVSVKGDDIVSFLPMEDLSIKACYVTPKQNRKCNEVMSSYTCFANNDVLMAKVTPCFENGKVGIACDLINGVGFGSSEFIIIRPKGLAIREYVYFLVQTNNFVEKACKQFTGTSGLRRVPKQFVEQLPIGVPPLPLQQLFAQKIEAIEKEKEHIKQSIKEVEELFNSRMNEYFG